METKPLSGPGVAPVRLSALLFPAAAATVQVLSFGSTVNVFGTEPSPLYAGCVLLVYSAVRSSTIHSYGLSSTPFPGILSSPPLMESM